MVILTSIIHSLIYDTTYWRIYLTNVLLYSAFVILTRNSKENPKKKSLWIASFDDSNSPKSNITLDLNITRGLEYINELNA
jgi:hypothetical protein